MFHPLDPEPQAEGSDGDDSEGQLEEIDFADIGRIQAAVDAAAARQTAVLSKVTTVKEQTTSFFVDTTPADISLKQHTPEIRTNRLDGGALGETVSDDDEEITILDQDGRIILKFVGDKWTPVDCLIVYKERIISGGENKIYFFSQQANTFTI